MNYTKIGGDHLEFQASVVQSAKGCCSAVDGRTLETAYHTSVHIEQLALYAGICSTNLEHVLLHAQLCDELALKVINWHMQTF